MNSARLRALMIPPVFAAGLLAAQAAAHAQGDPVSADKPAARATPSQAPALYMIRYRPGPSYRPGTPLLKQDLREHGKYMQGLAKRGVMIAAGPTLAEPGGLVLVQAASLEEARALMQNDPAVRSGIFVGEVSDWRPMFDPGGRFGQPAEAGR
jgi:uncharacterized protein